MQVKINKPAEDPIMRLIGKSVKYFDYLETERFGTIVGLEPYQMDPTQAYVYIEDNEDEFNDKEDCINGRMIRYAEIRPSSEVYIDE